MTLTPEQTKQESALLDYIYCCGDTEPEKQFIEAILDRLEKHPEILTHQVMMALATQKPGALCNLLSLHGDFYDYMLDDGMESGGWPLIAALTEEVLITATEHMDGFMLLDPTLFIQYLENMGVDRDWLYATFTPKAIKAIMKDCKEQHIWRNLESWQNSN